MEKAPLFLKKHLQASLKVKTLCFKPLVWNSPHLTLPVDYCLKERGCSWQSNKSFTYCNSYLFKSSSLLIPLLISGHIFTLLTSVKVTRGKVLREKRAGAAFREEPWREEGCWGSGKGPWAARMEK